MKFKPEVTAQMFWNCLDVHNKNHPAMIAFITWLKECRPEWLEPETRPCVCGGTEFVKIATTVHLSEPFGLKSAEMETCKTCGTVRIKL